MGRGPQSEQLRAAKEAVRAANPRLQTVDVNHFAKMLLQEQGSKCGAEMVMQCVRDGERFDGAEPTSTPTPVLVPFRENCIHPGQLQETDPWNRQAPSGWTPIDR